MVSATNYHGPWDSFWHSLKPPLDRTETYDALPWLYRAPECIAEMFSLGAPGPTEEASEPPRCARNCPTARGLRIHRQWNPWILKLSTDYDRPL